MTITAATVVRGLTEGLGIGALAAGLVLVYRASRAINLAQAELGAGAAALCALLVRQYHLPFLLAAAIAVSGAAAAGALIEILVVRRLRPEPTASVLIATAGISELLLGASIIIIGGIGDRGGGYPTPWPATVDFGGGVVVQGADLTLALVVPLLAVGVAVALARTDLGAAVRAASDNPDAARLAGIPVARLSTLVWAGAGLLSAVVAICVLAGQPIVGTESLGPELLFAALAAGAVARFQSLPLALGAGIVIGIVQQVARYNWPAGGTRQLVLFLAVVAALLVGRRRRPFEPGQVGAGWLVARRSPARTMSLATGGWRRVVGPVAAAMALGVAALLAHFSTNSQTLTFTEIAAYATLAVSTTLLIGVAGQVSLGQVGLFGLGAAASYQLSAVVGLPFWLAFLGAGALAAGASMLIAIPSMRGPGLVFAVTTLGFALVTHDWLLAQRWLIGAGVTVPRPILGPIDLAAQRSYFVLALVVLAGAAWLVRNLLRSGPGRRVIAVRDNEAAAATFGVAPIPTKLLVFALAGFLAGVAGAVYGHGLQSLTVADFPVASPGLQIGAVDSFRIVAIAVIGGLGSVAGAIAAAALIVGIDSLTTNVALRLVTTSVGLLVVLLAVPGGLAGLAHSLLAWARRLASRLASRTA